MSIRKIILFVVLFILGIRYSYNYITSEEFQKYADRTKAPWTCQVNMVLGGMYDVMSEYQLAFKMYERVVARCPNIPAGASALYFQAACYESLNDPHEAMLLYQRYVEKYPAGKEARDAAKAADRIRFSR